MPRAATTSDWAALLALTLLWGSAFLLNEIALGALPPTVIVAGRIVIATAVLFTVMRAQGLQLPREFRGWLPMLAMAVFGNVLPFNLVSWAQQFIDSSLAGVLMAVMPLFVLTLAHFLVPGARLTPNRMIGFVTGFAGVAIVLGPTGIPGSGGTMAVWGALAVLGAALSYSASAIIARRMSVTRPLQVSVGMLLLSSVLAAPGAVREFSLGFDITWPAIAALASLGLLSTGYATVLYFRLVQGPGPGFLSLVNYLVPVWAVMAGAVILDEAVPDSVYLGLVLILVGIAISELWPRGLAALRSWNRDRGGDLAAVVARQRG